MAAAAVRRILCKVFGENILSFGGMQPHPLGEVTYLVEYSVGTRTAPWFKKVT